MSEAIKPIPTRYRGYHFRSRLEARWAVFFDAMRVPWQYETEGYSLPSGPYLPDFWIPNPMPEWPMAGYWVEIKPQSWTEDGDDSMDKLRELTATTKHTSYLLVGDPGDFRFLSTSFAYDEWLRWTRQAFCPGQTNDEYLRTFFAMGIVLHFTHDMVDNARSGINASRSARFEHGESGAT